MYDPNNTIESLEHRKCTGCAACKNVCPVNAISMGEDSEFFIYPAIDPDICINCGKCKKICPAIEPRYLNKGCDTQIYAAKAADETREASSSGGVFALLSDAVLAEGGLVAGAAFDENFKVEHILADTKEDARRLRGSKYVLTDINLIYRKIKDELSKGKKVLFSGCPCQVAGLYGYLGKKHTEGLLSVDVLCHGVPSGNSLAKYLKEISKDKKIASVNFRDKKTGWRSDKITVNFEDGTSYYGNSAKDPYVKGFVRNLILRPSCSDCPFCEFPRQGDISLGDFWGIERIMPGVSDGKGVSLVMVNNKKGEKAFAAVKDKLAFVQPYTGQKTALPNRVTAVYPANPLRPRFFELIKKKSFSESVEAVTEGLYDVGLVSNYLAENFGGSLTQYALYRFLEDNGFSVLMIERPANAEGQIPEPFRFYIEKPYPEYSLAPQYPDKNAMRELCRKCAAFVVGSDQLFQFELYRLLGKFTTLDWVTDNCKKIAYAASFGHEVIWGNMDELQRMGYFMRKFDAFSVREKSGQRITEEVFGFMSEWVLDPVFLCGKSRYDELISKSKRVTVSNYIGAYILDPNEDKRKIIESAMSKLGKGCEVFSEFAYRDNYTAPLDGLNVVHLSMEERLQSIKNCDFFVTDSFHGTCLAIIMGKPFIAIKNKARGGSRFDTLLSLFGLSDRLIEKYDDLADRPDIFGGVDFGKVEEILYAEAERSKAWLLTALRDKKFKGLSDYDIFSEKLAAKDRELAALDNKLQMLIKKTGNRLSFTDSLAAYANLAADEHERYLVLVAVKDTPGLALNDDAAQSLARLGLKTELRNRHWRAFAAVIENGASVFERISPDESPVYYEGVVAGVRLSLESRTFREGNLAKIIINGTDYAVNKRGINIVIWDKKDARVADSVCFDTHTKGFAAYRLSDQTKTNVNYR